MKESELEKKRKLTTKHGFVMNADVESEVHDMCNLGEMYLEMGLMEGLEKGREQGIEQGIIQGQNNLKRAILLVRSGINTQDGLVAAGISPQDAKMAIETMLTEV